MSSPTPQQVEILRFAANLLEELWSDVIGDERRFYQGLIQVAVSLFHFGNGNLGGARKLYHSSRSYLEDYSSPYMGLDLDKLLNDLQACFQDLLDAGNEYPTDLTINESLIPRVTVPTSCLHSVQILNSYGISPATCRCFPCPTQCCFPTRCCH